MPEICTTFTLNIIVMLTLDKIDGFSKTEVYFYSNVYSNAIDVEKSI